MARHPDWWKTYQMVEVVRGLDCTEGDMMGVAVKPVLNSWVVLKKDTGGSMDSTRIIAHVSWTSQPSYSSGRKGGWSGDTWLGVGGGAILEI
jgi:hypothetical protein